ncbi:MAG TPA: hypothetical protein VHD90_02225 [Phototrophicaceae bacterium]|nr:hypothetical protein [Phototrophicaceae bacterium]
MAENDSDILQQVQYYRKVVLMYEALDAEIDSLIMAHGGTSDKMPPADLERYRDLARQRDELHNEMAEIEQKLLDDGSDDA